MNIHVLVVDNDPLQSKASELNLTNKLGYKVTIAHGGKEAIDILSSDKVTLFDAVLLDLNMPEVSGMDVLKTIKPLHPELPIIIHTAHGDIEKAVEALQEGAADFVEKQAGTERLQTCLENVLKMKNLQGQILRLQRNIEGHTYFTDIIGDSETMKKTKEIAIKAANTNISILIKGASGVGKELFARAIHGCSNREGKPFIAVNCGAIPENLVESVLFGHEKGSFTGAIEKTIGKFREADGGTLFLDEIGELRIDMQVKLLRALQESEIEPVGSSKIVKVDVRLISATNISLKDAVAQQEFREDLYYRINVFPFTIPSLKNRQDDIAQLLEHFTRHISIQEGRNLKGISSQATELLSQYSWPGNVRQLENAVYRAIVLCETDELGVADFSHIVSALYESNEGLISDDILETLSKTISKPKFPFTSGFENTSLDLRNDQGDFKRLYQIEAEIIESALKFYNWRISEVARKLCIGRSTLYRKMNEFDIKEQEPINE